jgi:uncharacterized protein YdaT
MFDFLKKRKALRFGEIAVKKGLADKDQISEALSEQDEFARTHKIHKEIGAILTEKGVLEPKDVEKILEEQRARTSLLAWISELFHLSR